MNPTLTAIGSTPPITLAEAKSAKRITSIAEDDVLQRMLDTAIEVAEFGSGRALRLNTYKLYLNSFSDSRFVVNGAIRVPFVPLRTVESIKYFDTDGNEQTLADTVYQVDLYREPGEITLKSGQSWPSLKGQVNAVTIEFTAGYSNAGDLNRPPSKLIQAIELIFGEYNINREDFAGRRLPKASEVLINAEKVCQ